MSSQRVRNNPASLLQLLEAIAQHTIWNAKKSASTTMKHHHGIRWELLRANDYGMSHSVNQQLQLTLGNYNGSKTIVLPVRILVDLPQMIQRPYRITRDRIAALQSNPITNISNPTDAISENSIRNGGTLDDLLLDWLPHSLRMPPQKILSEMVEL
jgi:hypothetical protein